MESAEVLASTDVSVLGEFELSVNNCRIDLARRERRLLALLTVQGESPRDFISGTLWPETTQDRAAASLRSAAYKIRCAVPDLLDLHRCVIGLGRRVRTDLAPLRDCLASASGSARFADPEVALRILSGGDLLAGWREDWVLHERERLRHRRLRALNLLSEQCLDGGDAPTAFAAAEAAESLEPLRERTHLLAVRALTMMGCHERATAHHRRFVNRLRRELSISPSKQFVQLLAAG